LAQKDNFTKKLRRLTKETELGHMLLAVLAGIILTFSFPPSKLSLLAWVALIPLFFCIDENSFLRSFKYGLIAGLSHYLTLIYWIIFVLGHYGNLSVLASLGPYVLLCSYLSVFFGFFTGLSRHLIFSPMGLLWVPGLWVSLEYLRANLLSGFPWCLLGYSQYKHLQIIQIADVVGVYGISFLIVLVNLNIFHLIKSRKRKNIRIITWETLFSLILVSSVLSYGYYRIAKLEEIKAQNRPVKALIVQGNIDQSLKWDPSYQEETLEIYTRLTRSALSFKPDIVLWPETAVPFFFQDNKTFSPRVLSLAKDTGAVLIFGSPAYRRIAGSTRYFNRAYLISPNDLSVQYYDKVHLVPFGEYIPLKNILSFIDRLVPAAGDFQPGDEIRPLTHKGLDIGVLICFESIFPELARKHTLKGANLLANLTNDAWFGKTSAPYQHLSMAVFRAVENKRPILRSANTGFSALIQPHGNIVSMSRLFEEEALKFKVFTVNKKITFYTRYGDLFAIIVSGICFLKILSTIVLNKKNRRSL
jgi:apolipoprotein N-acyltransferase